MPSSLQPCRPNATGCAYRAIAHCCCDGPRATAFLRRVRTRLTGRRGMPTAQSPSPRAACAPARRACAAPPCEPGPHDPYDSAIDSAPLLLERRLPGDLLPAWSGGQAGKHRRRSCGACGSGVCSRGSGTRRTPAMDELIRLLLPLAESSPEGTGGHESRSRICSRWRA